MRFTMPGGASGGLASAHDGEYPFALGIVKGSRSLALEFGASRRYGAPR